jgi:chloramphenicol 3-O-phosphotransferase
MAAEDQTDLRVAVVGACASGKSTLVNTLRALGFDARHVAQDHSFVADMWQRIGRPDVLIFLDVNYETIKERRPKSTFRPADLVEQERRLSHARENCDLNINTNPLTPDEILSQTLTHLNNF